MEFVARFAPHEHLTCVQRRHPFVEHRLDVPGDRKLQALARAQGSDRHAGEGTLCNHVRLLAELLHRPALSDEFAQGAVARVSRRARGDEVAHASESHVGERIRAIARPRRLISARHES